MAKQSILVLQHVACEGLGYFQKPLIDAGFDLKFVKLYNNEPITDISGYSALIVLGGYMNVYEEHKFPYLKEEDILIKKAVTANMPYLGICLGAQLLAKALEAKVYKNNFKEIGFYDIELTKPAMNDPFFNKMPQNLTVFQWHGDTFDLPAGMAGRHGLPQSSELLATSKLCKNQAFRYNNAYGLQFHLETTPEMINEWCDLYKEELFKFDSSLNIVSEKAINTRPYAIEAINNFINLIKSI
jgi:GMP synthase (glutamine-hydrolysing)